MTPEKTKHAQILTYAGILPFVSCAVLGIYTDQLGSLDLNHALITYGAVIASFIAGIHWGVYLLKDASLNLFLHSNIAALIAWIPALLMVSGSALILIFCFIYLLFLDRRLFKNNILDNWFMRLRFNATIIVVISLCLSYL